MTEVVNEFGRHGNVLILQNPKIMTPAHFILIFRFTLGHKQFYDSDPDSDGSETNLKRMKRIMLCYVILHLGVFCIY